MGKLPQKNARCLKAQPEFSALDKSRRFFLLGLTLLVFLFMGASIFYISTHVEVVGTGYEINQALDKKQQLIEENKLLALEIAKLKSPGRLDKEADQLSQFQTPLPHQTLYISQLDQNPWLLALVAPAVADPTPSELKPTKLPPKKTPRQSDTKPKTIATKSTTQLEKTKPVPQIKEKPRLKKLILAKADTVKDQSATKSLKTSKPKKTKEAVPAVLLDPMP